MNKISEADLIINKDGSIYHLNLVPDDLADTVITVGDQDRVGKITRMFNKVHLKKSNREFVTHTGELNGKLISVISTGIGTDNIDIVMNELDALVNIDLQRAPLRKIKRVWRSSALAALEACSLTWTQVRFSYQNLASDLMDFFCITITK